MLSAWVQTSSKAIQYAELRTSEDCIDVEDVLNAGPSLLKGNHIRRPQRDSGRIYLILAVLSGLLLILAGVAIISLTTTADEATVSLTTTAVHTAVALTDATFPSSIDDLLLTEGTTKPATPNGQCRKRREWRTLSADDKKAYITSVQCLLDRPSRLSAALNPSNRSSTSLYTDFPFIHSRAGYKTHHVAPFLPWHRYFLEIYHRALQDECGYQGELVYWDWTLDSANLTASPVFATDEYNGFGGDGDPTSPVVVGKTGRCVTTGPFAGKVHALFYDVTPKPHCLARGFRDDKGGTGIIGNSNDVSPDALEVILSLPTYERFVSSLEGKIHDVIPFGIAGDFETFTAPYDPLFFLHHVQLDRLWWLWQSRGEGGGRWSEYEGHAQRHSMTKVSLKDRLDMRGWAEAVEVNRVMSTEPMTGEKQDLLCYSY